MTAKELRSALIVTYVPLLQIDEDCLARCSAQSLLAGDVDRAKSFARRSRLRKDLVALMLEDLP